MLKSPQSKAPARAVCALKIVRRSFVVITLSCAFILTAAQPTAAQTSPSSNAPLEYSLNELLAQDAALAAIVQADSTEINFQALARLRLRIARSYYAAWQQSENESDLDQALVFCRSAADLDPDNSDAPGLLGTILSDAPPGSDWLDAAIELLADALIANPDQPLLRLVLASALMKQSRFWSAATIYEDLFDQYPAMIIPANTAMLALSYIADGRVTAGIDFFKHLEGQFPRNSGVLSGLASLYKYEDRMSEAIQAMTRLMYASDAGPLQQEYARSLLTAWAQQ